jgi:hypothetical protein
MKNFNPESQKNVLNLQFEIFFNMYRNSIMDNVCKRAKVSIAFILAMFLFQDLAATHIMGADLTYREIDTNTGRYRFTLSLYRDCSGITYGGEQLTIVT